MIDTNVKLILDRQKEILESLVLNPASTYDEYRQKVGTWQGIQEVLDLLANNKKSDE